MKRTRVYLGLDNKVYLIQTTDFEDTLTYIESGDPHTETYYYNYHFDFDLSQFTFIGYL